MIVFNPNLNVVDVPARQYTGKEFAVAKAPKRTDDYERKRIKHNESPPTHTIYVWDEFAAKAAAKDIVIVAHSAGGHCTMELLREREDEGLFCCVFNVYYKYNFFCLSYETNTLLLCIFSYVHFTKSCRNFEPLHSRTAFIPSVRANQRKLSSFFNAATLSIGHNRNISIYF